jgi:HlyD family secretion protein
VCKVKKQIGGYAMQPRKKKKKLLLWIIPLTIIVLAAVYGVFLRPHKAAYDQETAKTQDILTYYSFSGNVEPGDEKVVTAASPLRIKTVLKNEGDTVADDDYIITPKNGSKVEAGMAGILTDVYVEEDDTVSAGKDLFRIADYDHPVVAIRVDEYDVHALSVGQEVDVYVHALDTTLKGTISEIGREAQVDGSIAYYDAKISVPQDGTLRMGMSAEVTALKDEARMATTISLKTVQFDEDNQPYVYCYSRGEEVVAQPVLLGINNGSIVQVLDGVKSGETVLFPKDNSVGFVPFRNLRDQ